MSIWRNDFFGSLREVSLAIHLLRKKKLPTSFSVDIFTYSRRQNLVIVLSASSARVDSFRHRPWSVLVVIGGGGGHWICQAWESLDFLGWISDLLFVFLTKENILIKHFWIFDFNWQESVRRRVQLQGHFSFFRRAKFVIFGLWMSAEFHISLFFFFFNLIDSHAWSAVQRPMIPVHMKIGQQWIQ